MIVWQILMRTPYDPENPDKMGINRLLNNGVYKAAFPLHDGKYDEYGYQGRMSDRQVSSHFLSFSYLFMQRMSLH